MQSMHEYYRLSFYTNKYYKYHTDKLIYEIFCNHKLYKLYVFMALLHSFSLEYLSTVVSVIILFILISNLSFTNKPMNY